MDKDKCIKKWAKTVKYSEESKPLNTAVLVLQYCCSNWKSARVEIYGLTANASLPLWSQDSSVQADSWEIHILAWFGRHYSMVLNIVHFAERAELNEHALFFQEDYMAPRVSECRHFLWLLPDFTPVKWIVQHFGTWVGTFPFISACCFEVCRR